jgi:hypothetical protein
MGVLRSISRFFSTAAILEYVGLQTRVRAQQRLVTYAAVFAGGAAIGAAAALLMAPKSGRELRGELGSRARELQSRMGEAAPVQAAKRRLGEMRGEMRGEARHTEGSTSSGGSQGI